MTRPRTVRTLLVAVTALALTAGGIASSQGAPGPHDYPHTFAASSGLGDIPDLPTPAGGTKYCRDPDPADQASSVGVVVSGIPTAEVTDIGVSLTLQHEWVGDLTAELVAPDGTTRPLFSRAAAADGPTDCGSSSHLAGTYTFGDTGTGTWWPTADATDPVSPGAYRASDRTGANIALTAAFAGVADLNGAWTIRVHDSGYRSIGNVTAASLTFLTANPAPDTAITAGPADGSRVVPGDQVSLSFTSSATDLTGFECSFDGSAFAACTSPYVVTLVQRRARVFQVRALDAGGAIDDTPARRTLVVRGSDRCERAGSRYAVRAARVQARTAALAVAQAGGSHQQVLRATKKLVRARQAFRQARKARNRAC